MQRNPGSILGRNNRGIGFLEGQTGVAAGIYHGNYLLLVKSFALSLIFMLRAVRINAQPSQLPTLLIHPTAMNETVLSNFTSSVTLGTAHVVLLFIQTLCSLIELEVPGRGFDSAFSFCLCSLHGDGSAHCSKEGVDLFSGGELDVMSFMVFFNPSDATNKPTLNLQH